MSEQCAIGADGQLLDESRITWFHDANDEAPVRTGSAAATTQLKITEGLGRGSRKRSNQKMMDALNSDKYDEYGNLVHVRPSKRCRQTARKRPSSATGGSVDLHPAIEANVDSDDKDYPSDQSR
ncbi:hypothetical protein BDN71DRAFT_1435128 [Pleurotus eryngii]|uniref:Uncharacterized protein n=1 Tax=Pleurotus eryngii TaxID=5323 RepID=A0A9P5ZQ51_PLEER|nr:hypothetical protein BDN71DRAFT_1435128 [Pleurotus eryngii]